MKAMGASVSREKEKVGGEFLKRKEFLVTSIINLRNQNLKNSISKILAFCQQRQDDDDDDDDL